MNVKSLFLSLVMITTFPAAGCSVYAMQPAESEVALADAPPPPPPPRIEVIPAAPSPEYTWIPGHHRWEGRRYVWIPGRYDRRPHRDAQYVHGHWEHRGRVTVWIDGHWG